MVNRLDMFLVKVAEASDKKDRWTRMRNIRAAVRKSRPKTWEERQAEQLAGRQHTAGQLARGALIGAGFGAGAGLSEAAISKGMKGVAGSVKNPRQLIGRAVTGALFGAGVPAARRYVDIRAAEGGWY